VQLRKKIAKTSVRRFLLVFLFVVVVCAVFAGFFFVRGTHSSEPLTLVLQTAAYAKSFCPDGQLYVLYHQGQDIGTIELRDGKVRGILLTDHKTRNINIKARDGGVFPGKLSVDLCQGDILRPTETIADDDLDGIPDKRVEWAYDGSRSSFYKLEEIKWKPIKHTQSQPTTTNFVRSQDPERGRS